MVPKIKIMIQNADFHVDTEIKELSQNQLGTGAVTVFLGLVRDLSARNELKYIELEHYPGMTEKALHEICLEAVRRWKINGITVIHRIGRLSPGENIVLVLVSAKHRREAHLSSEFIMDFLKSKVPIWKKETSASDSKWISVRESDSTSLTRW